MRSKPVHFQNRSRSTYDRGFTIVEILVWIVLFTLGLLSAYLLLDSANTLSNRTKHEVVLSNLMRENLELVRNMRDTNWIQSRSFDSIVLSKAPAMPGTKLEEGLYTIENDYATPGRTILLKKLNSLLETKASLLEHMRNGSGLRYCLDQKGRYVHFCGPTTTQTPYGTYLKVEKLKTKSAAGTAIQVDDAYRVSVHAIVLDKNVTTYSMATILTDWKR